MKKIKDKKKLVWNVLLYVLLITTVVLLIIGIKKGIEKKNREYDDGIEQIDLNTIYLKGSKVEVEFSDVLLSEQRETRKLIVAEQTSYVSMELTDTLIKGLNFDFLTKTQSVSYIGTGYFVVDLDNLTKDNIIQDKKAKTLTICINQPYLQAVEIDPNDVVVNNVKGGFLNRGEIELTLSDYNAVEKELVDRLKAKFDTAANGQKANENALKMVKAIYEPIVKAIDSEYELIIEFK